LASRRILIRGPHADRTAATLSTEPSSPTLTLTVPHPELSASAAATSGATRGIIALTATRSRAIVGNGRVAASSADRAAASRSASFQLGRGEHSPHPAGPSIRYPVRLVTPITGERKAMLNGTRLTMRAALPRARHRTRAADG